MPAAPLRGLEETGGESTAAAFKGVVLLLFLRIFTFLSGNKNGTEESEVDERLAVPENVRNFRSAISGGYFCVD